MLYPFLSTGGSHLLRLQPLLRQNKQQEQKKRMRLRRRLPYETSEYWEPSEEKASLRPLAAEVVPMRSVRSPVPTLMAGIVIGAALSLTFTTWAVRTHRWPSQSPVEQVAATPMAQHCPAPAPPPAIETAQVPPAQVTVTPVAPTEVALQVASNDAAGTRSAHEKPKKKRKIKLALGVAVAHATTPSAGTPAAAPAALAPPGAAVEDQAAAELSESLK